MKFRSINIQNYGAFYGEHNFALDNRGLAIVLGDNQDEPRMNSNGAGKSTIFDALDWCLFGVVPRGDHADSVINEEVGQDCIVRTIIEDDSGAEIVVYRYRKLEGKTSGVDLTINGQQQTALDAKETQNLIDAALGLDREVFHAAVLFAQMDVFHFADGTDKERMDVLTKILQLGELDEWLERAKLKRKEHETQILDLETTLANIEGQRSALEQIDYQVAAQQWEAQREAKIKEQSDKVQRCLSENGSLFEQAQSLPGLKAQLESLTANPPQAPQQDTELIRLQGVISETLAEFQRLSHEAQRTLNEVNRVKSLGEGTCRECRQPVTGDHLQREIQRLEAEHAGYSQPIATAQKAWTDAQVAYGEQQARDQALRTAYETAMREHSDQMRRAQQSLDAAKDAQATIDANNSVINQANATIDLLRVEQNPILSQQQDTQAQVTRLVADLESTTKQLDSMQEASTYFDFWVAAFGNKGLKSYVIDSRLDEMTNAANQWVQLLTGGTVWIRFETQTLGRSTKKLTNKMNIRVFRYNPDGSISERNYRSWSGGEKQRVSLGIDFGLSRLIAARASKQYDLLILDELFKHLDQAGREAVMDMLLKLKSEKSSVFVVDHSDDFQNMFEVRLWVRRRMRRSWIDEENDEEDSRLSRLSSDSGRENMVKVARRKRKPKRTPIRASVAVPASE